MLTLTKYLFGALVYANSLKNKHKVKLLIYHENLFSKLKKIIYNTIKLILLKKNFSKLSNSKKNLKKFFDETKDNKIMFYSNENILSKLNFQKILPLQKKNEFENKGIGYIYDLQHVSYPKNFSSSDQKFRDKVFLDILNSYKKVLVNSNHTKKMIYKRYKNFNARIYTLPFCPYPEKRLLFDNVNIIKKYKIKTSFFLISNQFWKHKNYELAFKAFRIFLKHNDNFSLVCTGRTHDRRFPNYFNELQKKYFDLIKENKIIILGEIIKTHQISLLKRCTALIQPTLYEGGPGGFSSYEAVAYGVPLILSDIEVNKEIKNKNVYFFPSNNENGLAKVMLTNVKTFYTNNNKINLIKNGNLNKKRLGNFLLKIMKIN